MNINAFWSKLFQLLQLLNSYFRILCIFASAASLPSSMEGKEFASKLPKIL